MRVGEMGLAFRWVGRIVSVDRSIDRLTTHHVLKKKKNQKKHVIYVTGFAGLTLTTTLTLYPCHVNYQAVAFDVDSTVCAEEGIDVLADFLGQGEAVADLTAK